MKTFKKHLALALALILAFSVSATVLAAGQGAQDAIEGDGKTWYLDTEIYSVVLPTAAAFNFAVDPQGLLNIEDRMDLKDLSGGFIVQTGEVKPFINNSSVAIDLSVAVKAKSTAATVTGGDLEVEWVDAVADVTDGDTRSADKVRALLYVQPSSNDMGVTDATYAGSAKAYALDSVSASDLDFYLEPANYIITSSGDAFSISKDTSSSGGGGALQIGGYVDPDDNWKDFTATGGLATNAGTMGVEVVFTIAKATAATTSFEEGVFGLTAASATELTAVAPIPAPAAPEEPAAPGGDEGGGAGDGGGEEGGGEEGGGGGAGDGGAGDGGDGGGEPAPAAVFGWVEAEGAVITDSTTAAYTVSKSDNTTWTLPLELAGKTPTQIKQGANNVMVLGTDYTISGDRITISASRVASWGAVTGVTTWNITVDGTVYALGVNRTA